MPNRSRARVLAVVALMALAGCKESIPKSFEALVPEKGRGDIGLATEADGSGYGADKMLIVTYQTELTDAQLAEAYAETITGQGYQKLSECTVDGEVTSMDFLEPSGEHVQVFFRLQGNGETGPMLHVFKSSNLAEIGGGKGCTFTDAAKDLCVSLEDGRCRLKKS